MAASAKQLYIRRTRRPSISDGFLLMQEPLTMSTSFVARMCERFRTGIVRVCVTIGTALIVIAVTAIVLPFVLGVLLLAMAQRAGRRDVEPASIVVEPA
jgi:hypothetical protein